jgi:hypothetical protein
MNLKEVAKGTQRRVSEMMVEAVVEVKKAKRGSEVERREQMVSTEIYGLHRKVEVVKDMVPVPQMYKAV